MELLIGLHCSKEAAVEERELSGVCSMGMKLESLLCGDSKLISEEERGLWLRPELGSGALGCWGTEEYRRWSAEMEEC